MDALSSNLVTPRYDSPPHSFKHFHRRAGHKDRACFGPFEFQVAAGEVGEDFSIGEAGQDARDR